MKIFITINDQEMFSLENSGFSEDNYHSFVKQLFAFYYKYAPLIKDAKKDFLTLKSMANKYKNLYSNIKEDSLKLNKSFDKIYSLEGYSFNTESVLYEVINANIELLTENLSGNDSYLDDNASFVYRYFGITEINQFSISVSLTEEEESLFGVGVFKRYLIQLMTGIKISKADSLYYIDLPIHILEFYLAMVGSANPIIDFISKVKSFIKNNEEYKLKLIENKNFF